MTRRDQRRLAAASQVVARKATTVEAAEQMGVSYRQAKRILKRYRDQGTKGLQHRGRSRSSNRRIEEELKQEILERYQEKYSGFGPTLAAEKLEEEGLEVDHETLRRWLLASGLLQRTRRRGPHRSRRERKQHFGELVQLDGSHHRWMEDRAGESCLLCMVDDATGLAQYWMAEEESSEAALEMLWEWVKRYGIPHSLYVDGLNVYGARRQPTVEEQLEGLEARGPFELACQKLGIKLIVAGSPQAKGRVERRHGVMQDRFVKELRLHQVSTLEEARRVLRSGFVEKLNNRLALLPASEADFHYAPDPRLDLHRVFCWEQLHTVSNDWVIQHRSRFYQILRENRPLPRPKDRVVVQNWLNGSLHMYFKEKEMKIQEVVTASRVRKAG
jgi:transposase